MCPPTTFSPHLFCGYGNAAAAQELRALPPKTVCVLLLQYMCPHPSNICRSGVAAAGQQPRAMFCNMYVCVLVLLCMCLIAVIFADAALPQPRKRAARVSRFEYSSSNALLYMCPDTTFCLPFFFFADPALPQPGKGSTSFAEASSTRGAVSRARTPARNPPRKIPLYARRARG